MNNVIKNKQKGFSAVETLIALFILTVVGIVLINFQINIFSLNKISSGNLVAQEDALSILKSMTGEIRSLSQGADGSYAIAQAGTSTLTFFSDTNNDSVTEKVRYFLSGTTLKKGVTKAAGNPLTYSQSNETVKEVIHDVANATSSIFNYYDDSYDGTSAALTQPVDPILIRLVKINITIDHDTKNPPPPLFLTTQVSCRNLKDNL